MDVIMQQDRKGNENTTAVWERKIMRNIFGPVKEKTHAGSAPISTRCICIKEQILSQILDKITMVRTCGKNT
jgi:hypothetical protein